MPESRNLNPSHFLYHQKNTDRHTQKPPKHTKKTLFTHLSVFNHHFSNMKVKRELLRTYLSMCMQKADGVTGGLPPLIFPHNRTFYLMLLLPQSHVRHRQIRFEV